MQVDLNSSVLEPETRTRPDAFCGTPIWDFSLSWNTTDPDLTPCFEKVVLSSVPCGFLLFMLPFNVYILRTAKGKPIGHSRLNVSQTVLTALQVGLAVANLFRAVQEHAEKWYFVPTVNFLAPLSLIIAYVTCLILIQKNRTHGITSSATQFLFWFLLAVCHVFILISKIRSALELGYVSDSFRLVTFLVHYTGVLIMVVLTCFVEREGAYSRLPTGDLTRSPELQSSFISRLTFWWITSLIVKGYKTTLKRSDLWSLNECDQSSYVYSGLEKHWRREIKKGQNSSVVFSNSNEEPDDTPLMSNYDVRVSNLRHEYKPSLFLALLKAYGPYFTLSVLYKLVHDSLMFVQPAILKEMISFTWDKSQPQWRGFLYVAGLFAVTQAMSFLLQQYFQCCFVSGMRLRSGIIGAVYKKALRLTCASKRESTVGEIVNLISVDAQKFMDLTTYLNMMWSAPFQISLALYFLWAILGPSVLVGLTVMLLLIPINVVLTNYLQKLQVTEMKTKDSRVKYMNEILNGMKVLKLYAWEPSFLRLVLDIRKKELTILRKQAFIKTFTSLIWKFAPFMVSLSTFAVYVTSSADHVLDAEKAFVSLSLFNILRFPISILPRMISNLVQARVSLQRLSKFLNHDELEASNVIKTSDSDYAINVQNGTFTWEPDEPPILKSIDMKVRPGSLVAIIGKVAAGKSSVLSAILGEMEKTTGIVQVQGTVAYVPQQAWIQNATFEENVLFSKKMCPDLYRKVIDSCALRPDLEILPDYDQTQIGEKGINLSGGQKQRVSMARAVYNNADVYLLDDPLSAVDAHVGTHIFEQVIGSNGMLANKTRVLVTHSLRFLPQMDWIIVLGDGEIQEEGTYRDILSRAGPCAEFIRKYQNEQSTEEADEGQEQQFQNVSLKEKTDFPISVEEHGTAKPGELNSYKEGTKKEKDDLVKEERTESGNVKMSVYYTYFKGVGRFFSITVVLLYMLSEAAKVGANVWLSDWSNAVARLNATMELEERDSRLEVYGVIGSLGGVFIAFGSLLLMISTLQAASVLHKTMLTNILKATMGFFDSNPVGRILNRFTKDVDVLDDTLPGKLQDWLSMVLTVTGVILVASVTTPMFLTSFVPMVVIYILIQRFYVATSRQLKRLESVSRSPIYSHFSETISGASVIRAFGYQERFINESHRRVDENQIAYYPNIVANRWLAVRLALIGTLIVLFAALFAVLGRDHLGPGRVGLSVAYALNVTSSLNWMVRMTSELETHIVSVERIHEYTNNKTEAQWDVPEKAPPTDWPQHGEIEIRNLSLQYRESLDLVLKDINVHISPGEKVGIVGRTGAGKSSLVMGLFRILEPVDGAIYIDGVNIAEIGLHDLRSKLTVIPQDPVLFSGTLRMNLDPFNQRTDEDVWEALECSHMKGFVKSLPTQLLYEISEGGENISVGQRQLVCLARALLRKTKILILDEATAAVDLGTDDLIQSTIRTQFADCTVVTIAHRINTVMDYTRILGLENGRIREFDSPQKLLQDKSSLFYNLAKNAGLA